MTLKTDHLLLKSWKNQESSVQNERYRKTYTKKYISGSQQDKTNISLIKVISVAINAPKNN